MTPRTRQKHAHGRCPLPAARLLALQMRLQKVWDQEHSHSGDHPSCTKIQELPVPQVNGSEHCITWRDSSMCSVVSNWRDDSSDFFGDWLSDFFAVFQEDLLSFWGDWDFLGIWAPKKAQNLGDTLAFRTDMNWPRRSTRWCNWVWTFGTPKNFPPEDIIIWGDPWLGAIDRFTHGMDRRASMRHQAAWLLTHRLVVQWTTIAVWWLGHPSEKYESWDD